MRSKFAPLWLLLAPLTIAAFGCGEIKKIQECGALIDAINKGQSAMSSGSEAKEQIAKLEAFEKQVGEVVVTDAELKKYSEEYRGMVGDMIKNLKDAEKGDVKDLDKRFDEAIKKEDTLVDKMNDYCNRT